MKISELYKAKRTVISFEIFPPKTGEDLESVYDTVKALSGLAPDYISVTYGAAGSGGKNKTAEIAHFIRDRYNVEALAHLTCCNFSREELTACAADLKEKGIQNVLALRGDNADKNNLNPYRYAKDLISELKPYGFCLGAAAYPEAHIACDSLETDILYLKQKQDHGADFFITQLFFDNAIFYRFMEKALASGIKIPVSAGIMPILSKSQISRMVFMCGASLPSAIIKIVNKYGDEGESLVKAGVEYSLRQMQDLADNGADGIHIYTMNKPFIAEYCKENLKL